MENNFWDRPYEILSNICSIKNKEMSRDIVIYLCESTWIISSFIKHQIIDAERQKYEV